MIEEVRDQFAAFIAFTGREKRPGFLNGGYSPQQIEVCPTEEFLVPRDIRGFDTGLLPGVLDVFVDQDRPGDVLLSARVGGAISGNGGTRHPGTASNSPHPIRAGRQKCRAPQPAFAHLVFMDNPSILRRDHSLREDPPDRAGKAQQSPTAAWSEMHPQIDQ